MRRTVLLLLILAFITIQGYRPVESANRSGVRVSNPVWLPDGTSLLVAREKPGLSPSSRDPRHLYLVKADNGTIHPVLTRDHRAATQTDTGSILVAAVELWIMKPGQPHTLRRLWIPPRDHVLWDARPVSDGFLALTHSAGSFFLWRLTGFGQATAFSAVSEGQECVWSPSGRFLLVFDGFGLRCLDAAGNLIWKTALTGPEKNPVILDSFGWKTDDPGGAFYVLMGQTRLVRVNPEAVEVLPGEADPDARFTSRSGPVAKTMTAPAAFVSPGPSGQLLVGDGHAIYGLSLVSAFFERIASLAPQGRTSWRPGGNELLFNADNRLQIYFGQNGTVQPVGPGADPQFAPGGQQYAFWQGADRNARLFVAPFPSGAARRLGDLPLKSPTWLNSEELACLMWDGSDWQPAIYSLKTNTSRPVASLSFYTAQLSAWQTAGEAREFAARCQALQLPWPIHTVEAVVNGVRWYRVRLGVFETPAQVDAAMQQAAPRLKEIPAWNGRHFSTRTDNSFGWIWGLPGGNGMIFELMGVIYHYDRSRPELKILYKPVHLSPEPVREPVPSPDGIQLAFIDEHGRLCLVGSRGGAVRVLLGDSF